MSKLNGTIKHSQQILLSLKVLVICESKTMLLTWLLWSFLSVCTASTLNMLYIALTLYIVLQRYDSVASSTLTILEHSSKDSFLLQRNVSTITDIIKHTACVSISRHWQCIMRIQLQSSVKSLFVHEISCWAARVSGYNQQKLTVLLSE